MKTSCFCFLVSLSLSLFFFLFFYFLKKGKLIFLLYKLYSPYLFIAPPPLILSPFLFYCPFSFLFMFLYRLFTSFVIFGSCLIYAAPVFSTFKRVESGVVLTESLSEFYEDIIDQVMLDVSEDILKYIPDSISHDDIEGN